MTKNVEADLFNSTRIGEGGDAPSRRTRKIILLIATDTSSSEDTHLL